MLISVVAGIVFFFVVMFQCEPISYFWNKSNQTGQCLHIDVIIGLGYLYSVFSIISDFTFALIPAFLVWNLRLKRSAKMALTPLLTMGCVASFAVIARMKYVTNFRSPDFLCKYSSSLPLQFCPIHAIPCPPINLSYIFSPRPSASSNDVLTHPGATLDIAIWSTVEQGLAITAGSLATLRPLFHLASCKLGLTDNSHAPVRCSRNGGVLSPPNPIKSTTSTNTSILNCLRGNNVVELKAGAEARYTPGEGKEYEEYCLVAPEKAFHNQAQSSPNWYQTSFTKKMGKDKDASRVRDDNESEKSLRGKPSAASLEQHEDSRCWSEQRRNGSSDGHGHGNWNSAMQITVETTIHMSEEARHSRMSC
jgi:hypothetical protein